MGFTADISSQRLYGSTLARIGDVRCRAHRPDRGAEETSGTHSIVLPRAGVFVRHVRGQAVIADPNHVLFFQRDEPYRVSHPVGCGDRCTSIAPAESTLAEVLARHDPGAFDRAGGPLGRTHAPTDPGTDLAHRRLLRRAARTTGPDLGVDEAILDLLDRVLAPGAPEPAPRRGREDTFRAHADLAAAAKLILADRFRAPLGLDEVARAVASSPFHLARIFRHATGLTLHQYRTRLRLRAALEAIAENPGADLASLATALGFYDQSHLTNALRAECALTPARWRREASGPALRRMSKILQD